MRKREALKETLKIVFFTTLLAVIVLVSGLLWLSVGVWLIAHHPLIGSTYALLSVALAYGVKVYNSLLREGDESRKITEEN